MSQHALGWRSAVALAALLAQAAACAMAASSTSPLVFLNGEPVHVRAIRTSEGGEVLVWIRDLERIGFGAVEWDGATRSATLAAPNAKIEFQIARPTAQVTDTRAAARPTRRHVRLAQRPLLSDGRLMVPLVFVCQHVGVKAETRTESVVDLRMPTANVGPGLSPSEEPSAIIGKVVFADRPLAGVRLRLVSDADSTFLPSPTARTLATGWYRFDRVPPGRYRVYAYVGDNPDYFNRETAPVMVTRDEVVAPKISMGRVVRPLRPRPGARVTSEEWLSFEWTTCPEAAKYELSVVDPETHEEVALSVSPGSQARLPGSSFALGRRYHWRVLALTARGDFLGSTPGAGGEPWSFVVIAGPSAG